MLKKEYLKNKPTCKVTFTLPAEAINGVSEVQVLGDFNNWNHEQGVKMKSVKAGFETTLELAAGRYYEFRYLLDGNIWANDPAADDYHATPYGVYNSVVKIDEVATTTATPAAKAPVAKVAKATAPKATETKAVAAKAPAAEKTTAPAKKTTAKAAPKTTKKG
ncbi:MAG: isoamylase early set domain-containing protein [Saprospiraceae bacterium]